MSKTVLSEEKIYSTLEAVLKTISENIFTSNKILSSFPQDKVLDQLRQQGYNRRTSWAFLRASYWYLKDNKMMIVDQANKCYLLEQITEDKRDVCMEIFSCYKIYLQANYAPSLSDPNLCYAPEKAPKSSPRIQEKIISGGK